MRGLSMFSRFGKMPMGIQLALGAGSLGVMGLILLALFFWRSSGDWLIIVAVGLVLAILGFGIYRFFAKRRADKRGKEFTKEMASIPGQGDKAQDVSFSRAFEEGIEKYRQAGRKVMEQPWFLVIGEPSSGKTKAIKRSIRFDPLLTNRYQGSGGTQNMDWWFAQDAVVVDTAGKMAFPENAERVSSTWPELLRKLKKARPFAPINGVLLFISAESIQEKTVEQLQDEARVANTRLREINRDLGVRYPVWVIISKADKITGFREMLHELNAAEEQHQMFGWSNPIKISSAESDKPFDAKRVQEYVNEIAGNVERLRMSVMQNPTPRAIAMDPDARRLDEVDELYQLPEALRRIGYRLQLYLEEAMSQGVSGAPLFMRGIYFTSAEQKGDVLDLLLAEQLDIPVTELRRPVGSGNGMEEDDPNRDYGTPYFLKDLFERKVFEESGLVTAQRSVGKAETRRRIWMMGGIAASAAIVIGLGYWASGALDGMIRLRSGFWNDLEERTPRTVAGEAANEAGVFRIVKEGSVPGTYTYQGGQRIAVRHDENVGGAAQVSKRFAGAGALPGGHTYGFQIPLRTLQYATEFKQPKAGGAAWTFFWPARKLTGEVFESQKDAHVRVLVDSVLGPLVLGAYERFASADAQWDGVEREAAIDSFAELLRLEAKREDRAMRVEPLVRFVAFDGLEGAQGAADGAPAVDVQLGTLQQAIDETFGPESELGGEGKWPPGRLLDVKPGEGAIRAAAEWFVASQVAQREASKREGAWKKLSDVQDSLAAYQEAEQGILGISFQGVETEAQYAEKWGRWREYWVDLEAAHEGLTGAWAELLATEVGSEGETFGSMTVEGAIAEVTNQVREGPRANYDRLLGIVSVADGATPTEVLESDGGLAEVSGASSDLSAAKGVLEDGWRAFNLQESPGERSRPAWEVLSTHASTYLRASDEPLRGSDAGALLILDRFSALEHLAGVLRADRQAEYAIAAREDPFADVPGTLTRTALSLIPDPASITGIESIGGERMAQDIGIAAARFERKDALEQALRKIEGRLEGTGLGSVVAGQVELLVDESERPRPRVLPLTGVARDAAYEIAYHAGEARKLLSALDAMFAIEAGGGADPERSLDPLDGEAFGPRIAALRDGRAAYLEEYVNYWSSDVPLQAVPRTFIWNEAVAAFEGLSVDEINAKLAREFQHCADALEWVAFEKLASDDARASADRRRRWVDAALAVYGKEEGPRINEWTARVGDTGPDRLILALRQPPGEDGNHPLLTKELFGPTGVEPSYYYWSGLMLGVLEIAAVRGGDDISNALATLEGNAGAAPLSLAGDGGSLSFGEVMGITPLIQGAAMGGGGTDGWNDAAIRALPAKTQEPMERLLGWKDLDEDERVRVARWAELMTVLAGERGVEELRFEVVLIDFDDVIGLELKLSEKQRSDYEGFLNAHRHVTASIGEGQVREVGGFDVNPPKGPVRRLGVVNASTGWVGLAFAGNSSAAPDAWGGFRGQWGLFSALVRTGVWVEVDEVDYWLARVDQFESSGNDSARVDGGDLHYYVGLRVVNDDGSPREDTLRRMVDRYGDSGVWP